LRMEGVLRYPERFRAVSARPSVRPNTTPYLQGRLFAL
jgi:hypothetical protein